jgi:hypothetical protein
MRPLVLSLILASLLVACGKKEDPSSAEMSQAAAASTLEATNTEQQLTSSANSAQIAGRQFIREADLRFRVKDVYQASLQIEDLVAKVGGFIENNQISSDTERTQQQAIGDGKLVELKAYTLKGSITLRIPSEQTQAFLRQLAPLIDFLDQRSFSAHDAQLQLLQQQLAQIRSQASVNALSQPASGVSNTVQAVARDQAQQARDAALIQSKLLADQIAFSTITLAIYQTPQISRYERSDINAAFAAAGPSFGTQMQVALHEGWLGALQAIIYLSHLWPLWLVIALIALLRRKLKSRKLPVLPEQEAI